MGMDCPDLFTCVSSAHNPVLKTTIIWCLMTLNVIHMSLYLIGIDLYLTIVVTLSAVLAVGLSHACWVQYG
jgi:hypothetical protein